MLPTAVTPTTAPISVAARSCSSTPAPHCIPRCAGAVPPRASRDAPGGRTPKVLFLCTGNSARSQMAEALLEHRSGAHHPGASAGSHPKPLHPNAVRVMAERGIDISGRRRSTRPVRPQPLRPRHHAVRQGQGGLPRVPRFAGRRRTGAWPIPPPRATATRPATRRSCGPPTRSRAGRSAHRRSSPSLHRPGGHDMAHANR